MTANNLTWAEVDLSAIRDNIEAIRARVGSRVRIMPAVKANGYGHGAVETSLACLKAGADALCVAGVEEAIELRRAGIEAPVLILGCSVPAAAPDIVRGGICCTVCDMRFARSLSEASSAQGKTVPVHVKVDTGMGRIGIRPEEALDFIRQVSRLPGLAVEGVFTHFPCSDEPGRDFTLSQVFTFKKMLGALKREGFPAITAHASNSGGILAFPEADFDAVRPGIMIYGHYPSPQVPRTIPIREVLTLRTRIVFLRQSDAGTTVSYGRTHTLSRPSRVATLPVGYADGYNRLLSNRGEAAVKGAIVPVIGRVCMDQIMIDVTDVLGVRLGDEVTLYGGGHDCLSVSTIAERLGTISYEVLCNIGPRVPRIYLNR